MCYRFLTLPANFDSDAQFRVSKSFLAIFSVALLTAGLSLTGLLCFAVRNPLFCADYVFLPALSSCALGILTVFYSFLVNSRYTWNTAAYLTTVAAALSTIIYGGLLLWTHRRLSDAKSRNEPAQIPLQHGLRGTSLSSQLPAYQDPTYYSNYIVNMYPASQAPMDHPAGLTLPHDPPAGPPPEALTEEELTRQQMLMLLLKPTDRVPSPNLTADSFNRIDWESRDDAITSPLPHRSGIQPPPVNGYYAPQPQQHSPVPAYTPQYTPHNADAPQLPCQVTESELRPWDGVWRGGEVPQGERLHPAFRDARTIGRSVDRDERRRQIESGYS